MDTNVYLHSGAKGQGILSCTEWDVLCPSKLCLVVKLLSQSGHSNGFFPLCTAMWACLAAKLSLPFHLQSGCGHLYLYVAFLLCTLSCRARLLAVENPLLHVKHMCWSLASFSSEWEVFRCLMYDSGVKNVLGQ